MTSGSRKNSQKPISEAGQGVRMKKITVRATVTLLLHLDETTDTGEFLDEMDYSFKAGEDTGGDVMDTTIENYEVVDSR
jgi:hypothetical protein